jgi:hypothetical protein
MCAAWGATEVGEAGDEGTTQGLVVRPPGVVVIPPTSVLGCRTAWAHGHTASLYTREHLTT